MTSTEIAVRENGHGQLAERDVVDGWLQVASDVIKLAGVIAPTDFVPEVYRDNPPAVAAAILTGRELGIGPMTALRHVQVVKGSPTLSAEYKRARVLAAGHEFDILELNTQRCRVSGRRKGSTKPPLEITFTLDDAKKAGLIRDKGPWVTRPRRMLFARAGSELCDFLFADVTNGLPTAELVADGVDGDEFAGYDEAPQQASPAPAPRTARRRQAAPRNEGPSPAAPEKTPAAGPDPSLPPLPGEDEPELEVNAAGHPTGNVVSSAKALPDPDKHGTATRGKGGQLTALWTILKDVFGFEGDQKDQARGVAEHIIGRDLPGTTGDLSYNEARTVLDTLASWQKIAESRGDTPREVMITVMAEAGKADSDG